MSAVPNNITAWSGAGRSGGRVVVSSRELSRCIPSGTSVLTATFRYNPTVSARNPTVSAKAFATMACLCPDRALG